MLKIVSSLTLAIGLLASSGAAMADDGARRGSVEVRDHRDGHAFNVQTRPNRPPPAVHVERVTPRRGHVWVSGRYDWRGNDYAWVDGRWEQEEPNRRWIPGRWDAGADGYYVWIDGTWQDATPRVIESRPAHRRGFVWVEAHVERHRGRNVWVAGHWERARRYYR